MIASAWRYSREPVLSVAAISGINTDMLLRHARISFASPAATMASRSTSRTSGFGVLSSGTAGRLHAGLGEEAHRSIGWYPHGRFGAGGANAGPARILDPPEIPELVDA